MEDTAEYAASILGAAATPVVQINSAHSLPGYKKPKSRLVALHRKVSSSVSWDLDVPPATNGCEAISRMHHQRVLFRPGSRRSFYESFPELSNLLDMMLSY